MVAKDFQTGIKGGGGRGRCATCSRTGMELGTGRWPKKIGVERRKEKKRVMRGDFPKDCTNTIELQ